VRPLAALRLAPEFCGVVFDLDGTVLTGGKLTVAAYQAIHALHDAGLRLIACTGRPAGWGSVIARQWPIDAAITENGALAFVPDGAGIVCVDRLAVAEREARRAQLQQAAEALQEAHDDLVLTDDNLGRVTDVTFDIGETRTLAPERVAAIRHDAERRGLRTFTSSIHLHITLECDDKASGTLGLLARRFGDDPTEALARYVFVGDSSNDAACFAAFATTVGVSNVSDHVAEMNVPPRYVSRAAEGAGFAEIAEHILAQQAGAGV